MENNSTAALNAQHSQQQLTLFGNESAATGSQLILELDQSSNHQATQRGLLL